MVAISNAERPERRGTADLVVPPKSGSVSSAKSADQAVNSSSKSEETVVARESQAPAKASFSEEEVKNVAARLEEVINRAHGTEVRFNVTPGGRPNALSFQVIERETGEVVREFPAESVRKIAENAARQNGEGILFDEPA